MTVDLIIFQITYPGLHSIHVHIRRHLSLRRLQLISTLCQIDCGFFIFFGVDTSICVETSLRDAFNQEYDVILVSDATASGIKKHYVTTLERVRDYYGIVTHLKEFEELIKMLEQINSGDILTSLDLYKPYKPAANENISEFLEKHKLIDTSKMENIQI